MAEQQKVEIEIDSKFKREERLLIAQDVIDFIVNRTQKGQDINGRKWSGKAGQYSKAYQNSLDFKIAGKSKTNVNLTLSTEMLNSLKLIEQRKGKIVIGYDGRNKKLNGKVEGNRIGSYGKPTGNPDKARDFLGIADKDLDKIQKNYDTDRTDRAAVLERITRLRALLNGEQSE